MNTKEKALKEQAKEILNKVSDNLHKMVKNNSQNFDWIHDLREEYLHTTRRK